MSGAEILLAGIFNSVLIFVAIHLATPQVIIHMVEEDRDHHDEPKDEGK